MMNVKGILRKSPTKKRNVSTRFGESKSSKTIQIINHNRCNDENDVTAVRATTVCEEAPKRLKEKYSTPQLNSLRAVRDRLEKLKLNESKPITNPDQLTPRSKAFVQEEALKQLNFGVGKKLYKHLPPVNVNDSVLDVHAKPRKTKKKEFVSAKDPIPNLTDYLQPMPRMEHRLTLEEMGMSDDEPSTYDQHRYVADSDFRNTYEKFQEYFILDTGEKLM